MKKIAIKYGLWMFAGFTSFFLLMHLIGQSQNFTLRVFNGVIHLGLVTAAIRTYREEYVGARDNYLSSVAMGIYASVIGVVAFSIFMLLFLIFNPGFLSAIQAKTSFGDYLTPVTSTFFILTEGIAISLIGSYIITRILDMRESTLKK